MQVTLPDDLSIRLHQLAAQQRQPFEQFVTDHLRLMIDEPFVQLPESEQAELQVLRYLSDDALWTIATEQMAASLQERMAQLLDDNRHGTLILKDQNELASLIERGDQLMLRKAEAIRLLHQHGYAISPQALTPSYA